MEFLAELLGQSAEQQLRGETSKFDPTKGDSIERSSVERFFDERFGRAKDIQRLAQERQVENLNRNQLLVEHL